MVPWIANRGNSFKGAGMYYLHDKQAETSERVAWTHTQNLPTDDPHKAIKWMSATAMQAQSLKKEAGVKPTGRKSTKGVVYAYALAWHPDEKPEPEHMKQKALETLELLGLSEHQAVLVAHQETDHDHVHCVVNLIHPETGKTAIIYKDHLKLSEWALNYEQEHGQVYCKEREKNNELRKDKANQNKIIKHKEEKLERAALIQNLYERSDNGKSFNAALEEQGYSIAKGDKRGFVLVDHNGEIYSLSRQLKGQRASDLKDRLSDLDHNILPDAKVLSEGRKHFYRDDYEAQWQSDLIDNADKKEGLDKPSGNRPIPSSTPQTTKAIQSKPLKDDPIKKALKRNSFDNAKFDKKLEFGRKQNTEFNKKDRLLREYYGIEKNDNELKELQDKLSQTKGIFSSKKKSKLEDKILQLKLSNENAKQRYDENLGQFRKNQFIQNDAFLQKLENEQSKDLDTTSPAKDIEQHSKADLNRKNHERGKDFDL